MIIKLEMDEIINIELTKILSFFLLKLITKKETDVTKKTQR